MADLISHSLSLAGLQFLCAYFTYDQGKPYSWLFFLFVVFFSVYGELNNELRDIVVDQKAGIRHTADLIGLKWTKILMIASIVGAVAVIVTFLAMQVIPIWLLIVPAVLGPMLLAEQLWRLVRREANVVDDREALHQPALLVGVITILAWFIADKLPLG
ncbi:MAG: UbiA family prenyltransferase [Chloroflexi bacterium]|nr:UbiA family prenyltransferase [Chloroflexota bacterium]